MRLLTRTRVIGVRAHHRCTLQISREILRLPDAKACAWLCQREPLKAARLPSIRHQFRRCGGPQTSNRGFDSREHDRMDFEDEGTIVPSQARTQRSVRRGLILLENCTAVSHLQASAGWARTKCAITTTVQECVIHHPDGHGMCTPALPLSMFPILEAWCQGRLEFIRSLAGLVSSVILNSHGIRG